MKKFLLLPTVLLSAFLSILLSSCEPLEEEEATGSNVDTLYIASKDTIFVVDSLIIKDTLVNYDTTTIIKSDTIVIIDTIKTESNYDTLYIFDTLLIFDSSFTIDTVFIVDTTAKQIDTVLINNYSKKRYHLSFDLTPRYSDTVKIMTHDFDSIIPQVFIAGKEITDITISPEGRLTYTFGYSTTSYDTSRDVWYRIISGEDTLSGRVHRNEYLVNEFTINGEQKYLNTKSTDTTQIACADFGHQFELSWEKDLLPSVERTIDANTNLYSWVYRRAYTMTGDSSILGTEYNHFNYKIMDPLFNRFEGSFKYTSALESNQRPDFTSEGSVIYHTVKVPDQNFVIKQNHEQFDGLYYIGAKGWTIFEDPDFPNTTVKVDTVGTLPEFGVEQRDVFSNIYDVKINKNGSGYGIAHGRIGELVPIGKTQPTLKKLKKILISYTVEDSSDTVSFAIAQDMSVGEDKTNHNMFRAVLTSGCERPGRYTIDILDIDDFKANYGGGIYPLGTSLVDAPEYLETATSIAISPETEDPLDTTFGISIHKIYFIGEYGIYDQAVDTYRN